MDLNKTIQNVSNQIAQWKQNRQFDKDDYDDKPDQKKRYKYCCRKCKHTEKGRKACVCVVPLSQRRTHLGEGGCQTCACVGCSVQDYVNRGEDPQYKPNQKNTTQVNQFHAKNGCCRKCIKAFSKNNKACLCQVPKNVRKGQLPEDGCKFCGCFGCNPQDKKQTYRSQSSEQCSQFQKLDSSSYQRKPRKKRRSEQRQSTSSYQTFDAIENNFNNFDRSLIGNVIVNEFKLYGPMLGFGIPQRTYSYIMGRSRK